MNLKQMDFSFCPHVIQSESPADFHRVKLDVFPPSFPKHSSVSID